MKVGLHFLLGFQKYLSVTCPSKFRMLGIAFVSLMTLVSWEGRAQVCGIALGPEPTVCFGALSANFSYSSTSNNPDQYSIDFDAAAESAGFADVVNAPLVGSPITITVPGGAGASIYNAQLSISSSIPACTSDNYNFILTIDSGTPSTPGIISGTASQCPALTSQPYSVTNDVNASSYTWTVPTGWTITTGGSTNSITVTTGSSGQNGNITVTATNSCGTSSARTLAVTVSPDAPATPGTITGTTPQCPGQTGEIYSVTPVANATSYTWTVPTGWTITGGSTTNSITVTTGSSGQNGNITVTATNSCGTSALRTLAVTVNPGTPAIPGIISGTAAQCPALTSQNYSVTPVINASSYNWTVPTGWIITANGTTNSITVTTGSSGQNGSITVSATNSCGTSSTSSLSATVNPGTPSTPGTISGTAVQCSTMPSQIYSVTNDVTASSYNWTVPSGWAITAGGTTNSITVTTGSTGQNGNITVTASNSCGTSSSRTLSVTVNLITPSIPSTISGTAVQCPFLSGQVYSVTNDANASSYNWTVPSGWSINPVGSTTNSITVTIGSPGQNGNITVSATNSCGTSAIRSSALTVSPAAPATPGAISGITPQCPNLTGQIYSIIAVANAASYTWTVPTGWNLNPAGSNTNSITVKVGDAGQNGNITVTATNSCGTSSANTLPVIVNPDTPSKPGLITGTAIQCPSLTAQIYSVTNDVNATSYNWTVPTGWSITLGATTNSIEVTTGAAGDNGTITVTAANSCGISMTRNLTVTIDSATPPTPGTISGTTNQCPNLSGQTYSIAAIPNIISYNWTIPTGWNITSGATTNSITVTTGNTGQNGNITVTATNSCGTSAASSLNVTVSPSAPSTPGTINGTSAQCPATGSQIYSIAAVANTTSYNWTVPTGWNINAGNTTNSITVTTGSTGQNGNITVSATNSCGTSSTSSLAVTVNPGTPSTPGTINGTSAQCPSIGSQIYSIAAVANASSYNWTVPTGWITAGNTTNSVTVTTGSTGQSGNITVSATNSCGTSSTSSLAVTVNPGTPSTPSTISGPAAQCPALTNQTYSVTNDVNAASYSWTVPTGWSITAGAMANSITVTTGSSGQGGNITVTATNSCGTSASNSLSVTVNPGTPSTPGTITGITPQCPGLTNQSYSITAVANATTYTWTVPTGWSITLGATTNSIEITTGSSGQNGNITVTATNSCGTSASNSLAVTVNPGIPSTPGTITGTTPQCPGLTNQSYNITAVANATSYTWTAPTGWTITGGNTTNSITVTTGTSGQNGNIAVTATNSCGTSSARTLAVTVNPDAPGTPGSITGTTPQCPSQTGEIYSITPVANATSHTWTVPSGWIITGGNTTNSITVTTGSAGQNGSITVTATNSCGTSTSRSLAVTVNPTAPATPGPISGTIAQCPGLSGEVYFISPVANADIYTWTVPTGWNITVGDLTNSIEVTTGSSGQNGNITVTATNSCGTSAARSLAVTVSPAAPAAPGSITGITPQCPGLTGQSYSIAAVPNATSYSWSVPTGWTNLAGGATRSMTITTGTSGQNGNITVTATNSCGTSVASSLAVTINPGTPATPSSITGTTPQCPGLTGQSYSIAPVANATSYTWTVPSGWISMAGETTNSMTVTTGNSGQNGNITVTATNSCGTSAAGTLAVVVSPGTPAIPGSITGSLTKCPGLIGQPYSVAAVANAGFYTWTVPSGWSITPLGSTTNSITVTSGNEGDNGIITVAAGNSCGTSAARTLAVTILPATPATPGPITGTTPQCPGIVEQSYSITAVANATTYTWTRPTGWSITQGISTNSIEVTTGSAGQNGNITVTAGNSCGTSAASSLAVAVSPGPPSAPSATAGTGALCTQITANWTAPSNATSYLLDVSTAPDFGSFVPGYFELAVNNVLSTNVTGLTPGETYYYRVRASNSCGTSGYSNTRIYQTLPATPTAPVLNAPSAVSQTSATVSWSAVSGASNYALDVSLNNGFTNFVLGYQNLFTGNVTSVGITGLSSGTTYFVRLRAINSCGTSVNSTILDFPTVPPTPTGLAISAITASGFTVTWNAVPSAANFFLDLGTGSPDFSSLIHNNLSIPGPTSYVVTGLAGETNYQVRLRSAIASGSSPNSATVSATTLAGSASGQPTTLVFSSVTTTSFNIAFAAASGNPNYFVLRRADSAPTEVPVDGTGYTVGTLYGISRIAYIGNLTNFSQSALTAGTTYYYAIFSFTGSGGTANYVTDFPLTGNQVTLPTAPVQAVPSLVGQTTATLSWGAVTGATEYEIDVSLNNAFSSFVAGYQNSSNLGQNPFEITGLTPGTTYFARIRAVDAAGSSASSNVRSFTTIPSTPTGLNVTVISPTGFTLNWDAVTGTTNFFLDVSTDNFNTSFFHNNLSVPGPITYAVTGLTPGTVYKARLRSANGSGSSPNSSIVSITTFAIQPSGQPSALIFSSITTTGITVSYAAAAGSPDYLVLRRVGIPSVTLPGDGTGYTIGDPFGISSRIAYVGNLKSFTESGLTPGTDYHYTIYAFNGSGLTANYLLTSPLIGNQITVSVAPTFSVFSPIGQTSATLSWSSVSGASNYALDVSLDNGFSSFVAGYQNYLTGNGTSIGLTGLTAGTIYFLRLRAVNAGGASANSNVATFTTIPATPTGLNITSISSSGFRLNWGAVLGEVDNFILDVSKENTFATLEPAGGSVSGSATFFDVTGLLPGTVYFVRLRSANATGSSPNSSTVSATTLAVAPSGQPSALVFSSVTTTGFNVSFTPASGSPTLVLRRAGSAPSEIPVDGTGYTPGTFGSSTIVSIGSLNSFTETTLSPGITYHYAVYSFNGSGITANYLTTSPLRGSQITISNAPVLDPASSIGQTTAKIKWANVTGAIGYALDVSPDNTFSEFVSGYQNNPVVGIFLDLVGLTPGTNYFVRLRAVNAAGVSANSNVRSFITIPATPSGLNHTAISPFGFTLNWPAIEGADNFFLDIGKGDFSTLVVNNLSVSGPTFYVVTGLTEATAYKVRLRSANISGSSPNSTVIDITTLTLPPSGPPNNMSFNSITTSSMNVLFNASPGPVAPISYFVLRKAGSAPTDIPQDAVTYTLGGMIGESTVAYIGGTAGFSQTALLAGTTYYYSIYAFTGSGLTTNYLHAFLPLVGSQITRCVAPVISINTILQTSVKVAWPEVLSATDYSLDVIDPLGNFVVEDLLLGNVLTKTISNLTPGTIYKVRLQALNAAGSSAESNEITFLTVPATPNGLVSSNITTSGFKLSWNAVTGANQFLIDISQNDFLDYNTFTTSGPIAYTISGLASGTTFKVRVRSVNGSGESLNSEILTVATLPVLEPLTMREPVFVSELRNTPVAITVEVTGGSLPRTVTLNYRSITSTEFLTADISLKINPDTYETFITPAMADELGVEFFITSLDASNVLVQTPVHYFVYRTITAFTLGIPFNVPAFNGKPETFQMFSVPYEMEDKSVSGLFEGELGVSGSSSWRLFHYQNSKYEEYPAEFDQIELGKGYWFNTLEKGFQIKIGEASVYHGSSNQSFQMTLEQGWNQIGDPYPFNVDWTMIKAANSSAGLNSLYTFENGGYVSKNVLGAWKGAFVFSDFGGTVSFPITSKTLSSGREQSIMGNNIDEENWMIPLKLDNGRLFTDIGVGMHPEAKDSKDGFDEISRPRFFEFLDMNTNHPEFFAPSFSTDVVPSRTFHPWSFQLNTNDAASNGNLSWPNEQLTNATSSLLLLDETNNVLINMKTVGRYGFDLKSGQQFSILFDKEGDSKPGITQLGVAYPNPFADKITIPVYLIDDNSRVQINMYDALGRPVHSASQDFYAGGYYEILVETSQANLLSVADGLFYYRTTVNGKPGSLKRLLKQVKP